MIKNAFFLADNSKLYILNSTHHPDRSPPKLDEAEIVMRLLVRSHRICMIVHDTPSFLWLMSSKQIKSDFLACNLVAGVDRSDTR